MPETVLRLAVGDFRDRVRRPAYAVVLIAAVGLGYLATPAPESDWVVMQVGDYRGTYNSAYTGMVVALAATVWLPLGGFYVVRNAVARDEATGVGRLLATTPLRTGAYLVAKFLSSVLVLASMLGVLAVTALVMQWARGETMAVEPGRLLSPFVLIALPLMALTAAAALLFETIPPLRAGLGNMLWFFVWSVLVLAGQSPHAPFGGIGVHGVVQSLGAGLAEQGVDPDTAGEFSLGLTQIQEPLRTFDWQGFDPDPAFLLGRYALVAIALGLALLPVLWFPRFDPARGSGFRSSASGLFPRPAAGTGGGAVLEGAAAPGPAAGIPDDRVAARPAASAHPPRTAVTYGSPAPRLLVGEARILVQGTPLWWWAGVLVLAVVSQTVTPATGVSRVLLPAAWIWPVLIWSRLGTQRHEHGVEALLGAYPAVRGRTAAEWGAGVLLTAAAGIGPALRMATGADVQGLVHWFLGALFIPSFALVLGTLGRTHRLFQFAYLPLWYGTVNGLAAVDFMGAIRTGDGSPAGLSPVFLSAAVVVMLSVVFLPGAARRATS
ncbi:hypothetical protein AB0939_20915 [Streptomyces sp. NPDC006990]|uniref:hypothetical protein n=1 Tax=unclassified Streptomyces TaxID=2593676 RepID=UPI003455D933